MSALREIRIARGLTQVDLAKMLNTTPASVSRYESQETRLTLPLMKKLSQHLKVSIGELAGEGKANYFYVNVINCEGNRKLLLDSHLPFAELKDELFGYQLESDSMSPTMKDGDIAICHSELSDLCSDGLVILRNKDSDETFMARANWNPITKELTLTTDNPNISDYGLLDPDNKKIQVLGRVIWLSKAV